MLKQDTIQKIILLIKPFDPGKIILFGSQANDTASPDSDIDLLIIKDIPEFNIREFRLSIKKVLWTNLNELNIPFDIIVDSENRIMQRIKSGDTFYQDIITNGKVIYA